MFFRLGKLTKYGKDLIESSGSLAASSMESLNDCLEGRAPLVFSIPHLISWLDVGCLMGRVP